MKNILKQKWVWITVLFAAINIAGLMKISLIVEGRGDASLFKIVQQKIAGFTLPFLKMGKSVQNYVEQLGFAVNKIEPTVSGAEAGISIELNKSVDPAAIKGYVEVKPETNFFIETDYSGIKLKGDFKPGNTYTVTVLKGMPSTEGGKLGEDYEQTVTISDYDPTAYFKTPGMYMSLKGQQTIPVEYVNLDKLKFKAHKVYDNNVVYMLNNMNEYRFPDDLGVDVFEKEFSLTTKEPNQIKETFINLKELLPTESRGLYYLTIANADTNYYGESSKLILATDIGIVAKQSDSELLVWLSSLADTSPISNTTVKVFSKTNQLLYQGVTDEKGIVQFKDVDFSGNKKPFVITASNDKDSSFLEIEKNVLTETAFDIQGRPYLSSGYEAFLYTDRGIYRPGEKIHLRAIIRGKGVTLPESFPVSVVIMRPDDKEFKKLSGVLSKFGTIDLDIDIPDYALTGAYEANVLLPGNDKSLGSMKFNVEEFIPDNLKVVVKTSQDRFKISEAIPLTVKVQESFGAPAVGRNVSVSYKLKPINFEPKGYKDFSFTDDTKEYTPKTIEVGESVTDKDGQALFTVNLPKDISVPSSTEVAIKTVVKEFGGRAVTNYEVKKVDPYPYYIGIRQEKEGFGLANEPMKFDYVALSSDESQIVSGDLKVKVCKIVWNTILKKDENGKFNYITESKEEPLSEETIKSNGEKGSYSFTPKDYGDFIVRISGVDASSHTVSLKFYVSDPTSSQPWAMERPDRIELKFDREKYAVGDTAKLLIKSPFMGKALITCSTDKQVYINSIDLTSLTQEISIPVDVTFQPNAYCAVSVIRPVAYEDRWSAHRGFGIAPLMMDNSSNEVKIAVDVPEKVEPGQKIKLNISGSGTTEPMELSVALVDDGILRLTGFKTPKPFDFFYGKKANGFLTADIYSLLVPEFTDKKVGADSSPSGDKSGYDAKHVNPINAKRVNPISLWQSNVVTDAEGKASVEFTIPDFTGTLKYMVVAAGDSKFGNAEGDVKSVSPIMLVPTLSRFLSMNDQFILPVEIFNTTGQDGKVSVSVETSAGFEIQGEKTVDVDVKNAGQSLVSFRLKSPVVPQKGEIKISAMMGDKKVMRSFEIPIRPPVSWTSTSGVGEVKAGNQASFKVPGNWIVGTGKYNLSIQPLPTLKLAGGLKFLLQYPYGCVEQATSTAYPLLYLKNLAAKVDSLKYKPEAITNIINSGIERVLSMQTSRGGFAWWPGERAEYLWGSAYAMDFLVEADKAGYAVPYIAKTAGLNYLETILSGSKDDFTLEAKAYSVYVLAKAGRVKSSWIRKLQEKINDLPEYSRFHIAGALAIMGDRKSVDEILAQGLDDSKVENDQSGNLNSYVREQALALSIYLDTAPNSPFVPVLIKRIEDSMKDGRWGTTQENGMALIALGKYAKLMEDKEVDFKGSIFVDGNKVMDFDNKSNADLTDLDLGGKEIRIDVLGKGSAYYYWSAEGVPVSDKVEEKDYGLVVRRTFLYKDGKPVDMMNLKQGDVLMVDIAIQTNNELKNLVIEDLLPAGFEIENPRISTAEKIDWPQGSIIEPDHMDIRDDRLVLFTDANGKCHFRYVVRAVNKGEFILPAIKAELMYNPKVYSISGQGNIKIGE
ncbi:MAG: alpha-2-macroglobulin family protein [Candidatus Omnitrophica bacterium]|nr:alpha-2-macroglobulin family protein [Candidatus Omnitrophota bacterium]